MHKDRFISFVFVLLAVCVSAVSCDDISVFEGGENSTLLDYEFGYTHDQSMLEKMFDVDPGVLVGFNSQEEYDRMLESGMVDSTELRRNRFEYHDGDYAFEIKTVPKDTKIKNVIVSVSDTSIVEYKGYFDRKVYVNLKDLGDVDFTVTVEGNGEPITKVFPVRIMGTVNVRFRITPFWRRKVATKIRMNTRQLPAGTKDLVLWTKDSVTVIGYCEYYDFEKTGRNAQYIRDTITYETKERMIHYKKLRFYLVRNITDAIQAFESRSAKGSKIIVHEVMGEEKRDTVEYDYPMHAEQVILSWLPVCDNPYLEFETTVKCKKTFDHLEEGEEPKADWSEEDDDMGDGDIDVSEEDLDSEEDTDEDRETQNYFKVYYDGFMPQSQKDSLMRELNDWKESVGYSEDMTDEQKESALDEINRHLDDDQKVSMTKRLLRSIRWRK